MILFLNVFEIMVIVVIQSAFYLKIHQNNIFFISKKLFLISTHQNNNIYIYIYIYIYIFIFYHVFKQTPKKPINLLLFFFKLCNQITIIA